MPRGVGNRNSKPCNFDDEIVLSMSDQTLPKVKTESRTLGGGGRVLGSLSGKEKKTGSVQADVT